MVHIQISDDEFESTVSEGKERLKRRSRCQGNRWSRPSETVSDKTLEGVLIVVRHRVSVRRGARFGEVLFCSRLAIIADNLVIMRRRLFGCKQTTHRLGLSSEGSN